MSDKNVRSMPVSERKATAFLAYSLLILLIILLLPASAYAITGTPTFGAEATFNNALFGTTNVSSAALSDSKFVVVYRDNWNSGNGTAVIGSVSGTDMTFGSKTVFNAAGTTDISVSALSDSKFVVAYFNSSYGMAVVGDVSGSTITFGPAKDFNLAGTSYISTAALSPSKFVVSYRCYSSSGRAKIGDVSGNVITFGSHTIFNPGNTTYISTSALTDSKIVIAYSNKADSDQGTAIIGDVSGTDITFGAETVFNAPETTYISVSALTDGKFVVAYLDGSAPETGTAVIGSVSGNVITYGVGAIFNRAKTYFTSTSAMSASRFVVAYEDKAGLSRAGTAIIGDVSGTTITYGSEKVFNPPDTDFNSASALSASKFVVAYTDSLFSLGRAVIGSINAPSVETNQASGVTYSGATLSGNITNTGGEDCSGRGFQYRIKGSNTWTEQITSGRFGTGSFNQAVSGLSPDTTYEFKARASNSGGPGEGSVLTFTTAAAPAKPAPAQPPSGPTKAGPTWYLAEGSTAWGFSDYISIENPNSEACTAKITYMTTTGPASPPNVTLPAMSQTTVNPRDFLGAQDFSTLVECLEGKDIAVDRTMTWTGPGAPSEEGHNSIGVTSPNTVWYLPEGSSAWDFECWLLIQNPNPTEAICNITYMVEGSGPATFSKKVPAKSRRTFNIADDIKSADASIKVEANIPVIPERAMYRHNRREGHDSIGTTLTASDYYLAEGTSAWGFTTYVLIQNPNKVAANVTVTYMTPDGTKIMPSFTMNPSIRKTVRVNDELPNTDLSIHVHADQPIIAERAMYWGAGTSLGEACHDSIGMEAPRTSFYLPDGETSNGRETWTLVQNPNNEPVNIRVSYLVPDGKTNVVFTDTLKGNSRKTYNMADQGIKGRAAVLVTSLTPDKKIMVERAMYWNSRGAGTDTIGGYSD